MLLSDRDIELSRIRSEFELSPWNPDCVQPSSYDVHLSESFQEMRLDFLTPTGAIDPENIPEDTFSPVNEAKSRGGPVIYPGQFLLGSTVERLELGPLLAAVVEGKSSLGRLGLQVHATAGFIDPGFQGNVTLELSNVGPRPVWLKPGMAVAQFCFLRMSSHVRRLYGHPSLGSHYQGQTGATPPRST